MSKYTLSINIHAESKELLENLMVTLESMSDDIHQLTMIELLSVNGSDSVSFNTRPCAEKKEPGVMQRNLFLDKWMFY